MATGDDDEVGSPFGRLIYRAQEEMDEARMVYFQQRAADAVTSETVSYLQASLMRYYSIMWRYRDETQVEDEWPADEFQQLQEHVLSETPVQANSAGRGSRTSVKTRPGTVDAKTAIRLSFELDDIATKLGFAAPAKEVTPHTQATEDDLAALLTARGQEQALENLPARFRSDDDGDD